MCNFRPELLFEFSLFLCLGAPRLPSSTLLPGQSAWGMELPVCFLESVSLLRKISNGKVIWSLWKIGNYELTRKHFIQLCQQAFSVTAIHVSWTAVQNVAAWVPSAFSHSPLHKSQLTGFTEHWRAHNRVRSLNPSPFSQSKCPNQ